MNNSERAFIGFENYESQFEELKGQLEEVINSTNDLELIGINDLESRNSYLNEMEKTVELLLDNVNRDYREKGSKGTKYLVQYTNLITEVGEFVKKLGDFSQSVKDAYDKREELRKRLNKECQVLDKEINNENAKISDALFRVEREERELESELSEADKFFHESEKNTNEKYSELLKENLVPIVDLYDDYLKEIDVLLKGGEVNYAIDQDGDLIDLRKNVENYVEEHEEKPELEEKVEEPMMTTPVLEEEPLLAPEEPIEEVAPVVDEHISETIEEPVLPEVNEPLEGMASEVEEEVMPKEVTLEEQPVAEEVTSDNNLDLPNLSDENEFVEDAVEPVKEEVTVDTNNLENPVEASENMENTGEASFDELFENGNPTETEDDSLGHFEGFLNFEDVLNSDGEANATEETPVDVPSEPAMEATTDIPLVDQVEHMQDAPIEPALEPVMDTQVDSSLLSSLEPNTEEPSLPEAEPTFDPSLLGPIDTNVESPLDKFNSTPVVEETKEEVISQHEASIEILSKVPVDAAKAFMAGKLTEEVPKPTFKTPSEPEQTEAPTTKSYFVHEGETLSADVTDEDGNKRNVEIDYTGERVVRDEYGKELSREFLNLESEVIDGAEVKKITSDLLNVPIYGSESLHM